VEKVTYFDVEYANSKNKSICQIGIVCDNYNTGDPYYPELDIYINPEDRFDDVCVGIHGISEEKVKNEKTFPQVWKNIEKYFTNAVVIGHNLASADLDALVKSLHRYNIDVPEIYYICTYELAKEFIPRYTIENYKMSTLCAFFDIDIDCAHNAFDDASANADLFKTLVNKYDINIESHIKKYIPHEAKEFSDFIANSELRKKISEFYGIIRGFSADGIISREEKDYIENWRNKYSKYISQTEIAEIICVIDKILEDGVVTVNEMFALQSAIKKYLDVVTTSPITLSTQILDGIMRGIVVDGEITEEECKNLRQWLYDNIYLMGHYPFDKVMKVIDEALEDMVITSAEAEYITEVIENLLNPVETLRKQINSVDGKTVCLSGNFEFGSKEDVKKYIVEQGGMIDSSVKKTTNILMIGNNECKAYSNGTYGTKVKKAIEYNEKGCNIQIIKEADFFK